MLSNNELMFLLNAVDNVVNEETFSDVVSITGIKQSREYELEVSLSVRNDIYQSAFFGTLQHRIVQVLHRMLSRIHSNDKHHIEYEVEFNIELWESQPTPIPPTPEDLKELANYICKCAEENVMANSVPVKEIIHRTSKRGEFFTVVWGDDTKTTVKLMEGDTSDEYSAFLFALGKKIFPNKGVAREYIRSKKEVFENRMLAQSIENRRAKQMNQFNSMEKCDFCRPVFFAPSMVSKKLFKKNKEDM